MIPTVCAKFSHNLLFKFYIAIFDKFLDGHSDSNPRNTKYVLGQQSKTNTIMSISKLFELCDTNMFSQVSSSIFFNKETLIKKLVCYLRSDIILGGRKAQALFGRYHFLLCPSYPGISSSLRNRLETAFV